MIAKSPSLPERGDLAALAGEWELVYTSVPHGIFRYCTRMKISSSFPLSLPQPTPPQLGPLPFSWQFRMRMPKLAHQRRRAFSSSFMNYRSINLVLSTLSVLLNHASFRRALGGQAKSDVWLNISTLIKDYYIRNSIHHSFHSQ